MDKTIKVIKIKLQKALHQELRSLTATLSRKIVDIEMFEL